MPIRNWAASRSLQVNNLSKPWQATANTFYWQRRYKTPLEDYVVTGDEICFDYAMCDGTPYDEFICSCGSENCRGNITGENWERPDLRERYAGYYMPYPQRRIDLLNAIEAGKLSLEVSLGI